MRVADTDLASVPQPPQTGRGVAGNHGDPRSSGWFVEVNVTPAQQQSAALLIIQNEVRSRLKQMMLQAS